METRNPLARRGKNVCYLLLFLGLGPVASSTAGETDSRPNILIILADDLGYSDLGCYGSEIATPNLDGLARDGLRFSQFYNTARCWPSRAALLTGYYAQQVRRDTIPGVTSGAQGTRQAWARLLPELLRPLGYRSYHSGKWHVDGLPLRNGFDHSYCLNDHDRHFAPKQHTEDGEQLPPVEVGSGYYSSTAIADHAIKYLKDHATHQADRPFFAYVAFTAPHFPVQAPAEAVARYRPNYRAGWDALREARWKRMKAINIGGSTLGSIERDQGPPYAFPDAIKKLGPDELDRPLIWSTLNSSQREFQASKMAVHAAMVDRMDTEIGRILDQVRAMNALEDTLILFLSDNGASAEMMVRGDGHDPFAEPGSRSTYLSIGPGWSSLANTPFRKHKTWVHEGGIATPLIVHWPKRIAAKGEIRQTPGHVIDIVPTILEITGSKPETTIDGQPVPPRPGKSLVPAFARDEVIEREYLWWLHEGNRALRVGDWKIVAAKGQPWELHDFTSDRSESRDMATEKPDKLESMVALWTRKLDEFTELATKDLPEKTVEKRQSIKSCVKVFILAGQSNMEGQAVVDLDGPDYNNGKGTLKTFLSDPVASAPFAHLRDGQDGWSVRNDVWVRYQPEDQPLRKGPMSVGFAVYDDKHHFGPELEFGHVVGDQVENQLLIIKTAWGGKSLYRDFRPPSSGGEVGPYYTKMIREIREAIANLPRDFGTDPGTKCELAGFVWYQGWNDGVDPRHAIPEYEQNLVNLIKDVRRDLNAPSLPVVVCELTGPWVNAPEEWSKLRKAQEDASNRPELGGNVLFVPTHDFVRKPEDSPNPGHGHHEFGNAETYLLVGKALGNGMMKLLKPTPTVAK